ncbi:MAG: hypothetical protein QM709_11325 [Spongiibacteraceae bacterium]
MKNPEKPALIAIVIGVFLLPILIIFMPKIFSLLGAKENDYLLFKALIALFFGGLVWAARSFFSVKTVPKNERKPDDEE